MSKRYTFSVTKPSGKTSTVTVEADNMRDAMDELDPKDGWEVDVEKVEQVNGDNTDNKGDTDKSGADDDSGEVEIISVDEVTDDDAKDDAGSNATNVEKGDDDDDTDDDTDNDNGDGDDEPERGHWWDGDWKRRQARRKGE